MITNERQYKITKSQLNKLSNSIKEFNLQKNIQYIGSEVLAFAELNALKSEAENLADQLKEYEILKSGSQLELKVDDFLGLPKILIQARIFQNLSQKELAELIGIKEQQIQRYESEIYASANLKRLQKIADVLNIKIAKTIRIDSLSETKISKNVLNWKDFPIKEMYKRGWFEGITEPINTILSIGDEIIREYVSGVIDKPALAFNHLTVRTDSQVDKYSLLAWYCRVIHLSKKQSIPDFEEKTIDPEWISQIVQLSKSQEGPLLAKNMLNDAGIHLIIEPHLPNTYLDGAAILIENSPIIAMTLRYDRIDNFWFVLLHELMHILNHLQTGHTEFIFDDLDNYSQETIEIEADQLASEALLPNSIWENSLAKFMRSKESVIDLANKQCIHEAIIAGRIRYESNNYVILSELIGQGEVRKQFQDVYFGI